MAESAIAVGLSIDDVDLAERVRGMLGERCGFEIIAVDDERKAEVLVTDATGDFAGEWTGGVRVLVLTDASEAADALYMGAAAVLSADVDASALRAAIRAAVLGLTTLSGTFRHRVIDGLGRRDMDDDDAPAADLTARELQVLQLLAEGASNKTIARRLGITPNTAKFHVAAITGKLGASGRTDAVAKAMRLGLVMV